MPGSIYGFGRGLRKRPKFGRTPKHRRAMFRNMVTSLIEHERILTTLVKAKQLRGYFDRMVTIAKRAHAHPVPSEALRNRRRLGDFIFKKSMVRKLLDITPARFEKHTGGYTRIIRSRNRKGDNAKMAYIEMVGEPGPWENSIKRKHDNILYIPAKFKKPKSFADGLKESVDHQNPHVLSRTQML